MIRNIAFVIWLLGWPLVVKATSTTLRPADGIELIIWIGIAILIYERRSEVSR